MQNLHIQVYPLPKHSYNRKPPTLQTVTSLHLLQHRHCLNMHHHIYFNFLDSPSFSTKIHQRFESPFTQIRVPLRASKKKISTENFRSYKYSPTESFASMCIIGYTNKRRVGGPTMAALARRE